MYETERLLLIEQIKKKGITNQNVLDAMSKVERHLFVPDIMQQHAYEDVALPIGYGQTISQPHTVAAALERPVDKKAAILFQLGAKVFTIERNDKLYNSALKIFDKLNLRIAARCSDGSIGWLEFAPYDGIIVTAGSPGVPQNLLKQLAAGGRMIIPVGDCTVQSLKIITKISDDEFDTKEAPYFAFVPLVGREGWKEK